MLSPTALLNLLLIAVPFAMQAQFTYGLNNGKITITRYDCSSSSVAIPSTINGFPVAGIGNFAFSSCSNLTDVTIPNSVTAIGSNAFSYCSSLTGITIPNNVVSIGDLALFSCPKLINVTIPSSVVSVGYLAFGDCTSLSAIAVNPLNPVYSSMDGVLFDRSQTTLIQCPAGKAGSYTIANGVTNIGENAFSYCDKLTSVAIPNTVASIRRFTFFSCSGLTNVTIPNTVSHIGDLAFYDCWSLTSVTIPNSVTTIGTLAFYFCSGLTAVYFQGNAPSWVPDGTSLDVGGGEGSIFLGDENLTIYYLAGTTGWGTTFGGRPTSLWLLPYPVILDGEPNFGVRTNGFGFTISWATNTSVAVEACTNLGNPVWSPVETNTLSNGWSYFSDRTWTNYLSRFFRVRSQ